ncbi:MAG: glycogen/starch synthase, partial [Candidatus Aenigmarchaeota archaeon]|nr:glycogen/starch synthase [Candidatus Aenigmarchaeota archaeon]
KADYFFEVSYEVANKVGGIYTVITSKAGIMAEKYGSGFMPVGPWIEGKSYLEFSEKDAGEFKDVFDKLAKRGIICKFGTWGILGSPNAILIDSSEFFKKNKNQIKTDLWNQYGIDSIRADCWFDDPIVFSYAAGILIDEISKKYKNKKCVAQFHEWLTGAGLLYLKNVKSKVGTVFTTHATMLGRTMAGVNENLHEKIETGLKHGITMDPQKAYHYGVESKHLTEIACAKNADVFTTVSKTTAKEAEFLLGRKPDVVLPNGLNLSKYPSMEDLSVLHKKYKMKITNFLRAYFRPYYDINVVDPRIMFISGRYEYHNKGIDMCVESLGRLNNELKNSGSKKDVFVFFLIPADINGENVEVLKNVTLFNEIENYVDDLLPEIKHSVIGAITRGVELIGQIKDSITETHLQEIKKQMHEFRSKVGQIPPLCAFNLNYNLDDDSIIKGFKANGLLNRKEDRVKVIFYPAYLSNADRLISINYNSFIIGSSMGIFPSFYEPWGYTPVECAANGCLSITTDYAGFGKFIDENRITALNDKKDHGIYILKRENTSYDVCVETMKKKISDIVHMTKNEIVEEKHIANRLAYLTDWKYLGENYIEAHNIALKKNN